MQIRTQGRRIQCIRSEYDPTVKRSRQRVIAHLPSWATSIKDADAAIISALTDEERQQLTVWLDERKERQDASSRRYRAQTMATTLHDLAAGICAGEIEVTPDYAAALWQELGAVGKALRKAGHPRQTRARKTAPKKEGDGKQADLLG